MAEKTKMPASQRAKQFAPFAALKGFEDAIERKVKVFLPRPEFSEEMALKLDNALQKIKKGQKITVTYYYDGEYFDFSGTVKKLDLFYKTITIDDNIILLEDITEFIFL